MSLLSTTSSNCFHDKNFIKNNSNPNQEISEDDNIFPKFIKINICKGISIFFSPDKSNISLTPILPSNRVDLLFKIYNLKKYNISKEKKQKKIESILSETNSNLNEIIQIKKFKKKGIKAKIIGENIQIIDKDIIKNCIINSKKNSFDSIIDIVNAISMKLFDSIVHFEYSKNKKINNNNNNDNTVTAKIKYGLGDYFFINSDPCANEKEAKLNVLKKFIIKYLPEKYSKLIINNISESIKRAEKTKEEKSKKYEKYLKAFGGDRNLLKNKRKIKEEEFNKRLPFYNMLDREKKNQDKNNLILSKINSIKNDNNIKEEIISLDDDDEMFFMNTEKIPINEILLGDLGIVDNHLRDFKYSPLKLYEMIRDSEKSRGVDFTMEYAQINDKKYCHKNEVTIISQKLGIKVQGYGKKKEEAENKCALTCLSIIFKKKFKTFYDLHTYFENKKGKYLDIILSEDNKENQENKKNIKIIKNSEFNIIKKNNEENAINNNEESGNNDIKTYINKDNNNDINNDYFNKDINNNINNYYPNNFFNDGNLSFSNNNISEINNSSGLSNNNSNTSKTLIEALSNKEDNNDENCSLNKGFKKIDDDFDSSLFYL